MISGGLWLAMASFRASPQKTACIVLLNRKLSTLCDAQLMIATRYRKPFLTGKTVKSAHQTWFGRSICIFFSKYGKTVCYGCGWLIMGGL